MEACATIANALAAATTPGAELLLSRPSSVLAVSALSLLPVDALAPPKKAVRSDTQRAPPRSFVRRTRRTRRRSLTGDGDGEEGYAGVGDGDDGAFGGGGRGGGGGGGGRWWNFEGNGGADWGDSGDSSPASPDPAFDFVYGVISCVALYSCTQFAFKRVGTFMADREKVVPLRLVPQFAD